MDDKRDTDTPMHRFEELGRKLFQVAKKDVEEAKERVEEAAEEIATPEEPEAET